MILRILFAILLSCSVVFATDYRLQTLEEAHEIFANFTLLLVFVHVVGVIMESLIHKENLVKSMFTGLKSADAETISETSTSSERDI